jgi:hypothetical protein
MDAKKNIAFVVMTHGNERVGHFVLYYCPYGQTDKRRWDVIVGNPEAYMQGVRYVDEDLNRLFDLSEQADTVEGRRAVSLRRQLEQYDQVYDIHQYTPNMLDTQPIAFINNMEPETLQMLEPLDLSRVIVDDNPKYNKQYVTSVRPHSVCIEYAMSSYIVDCSYTSLDFERIIEVEPAKKEKQFYRSVRSATREEVGDVKPWDEVTVDGKRYYTYFVDPTEQYGSYCWLAEKI